MLLRLLCYTSNNMVICPFWPAPGLCLAVAFLDAKFRMPRSVVFGKFDLFPSLVLMRCFCSYSLNLRSIFLSSMIMSLRTRRISIIASATLFKCFLCLYFIMASDRPCATNSDLVLNVTSFSVRPCLSIIYCVLGDSCWMFYS